MGSKSHPTDCSKYVECFNGIAYERDCPKGLLFDKKAKQCLWAHTVKCWDG